jgi:ATP-binding cassette, subfamily B, bacterial
MTAGKMALVVSHRLALAREADRIAVMDRGRVVESGTDRELMDSGGLYLEMFSSQAESYVD